MLQILIADDHQMLREGFERAILRTQILCEIKGVDNGKALLELKNLDAYDLIFMDVNMPHLNGIETTRMLVKKYPNIKIIALSQFDDRHTISRMIDAGAKGYMLKSDGDKNLKENILDVMSGKTCFPKEMDKQTIFSHGSIETLNAKNVNGILFSAREVEILSLVGNAISKDNIAKKLNISVRTVEWHKTNIMKKANVKTALDLVAFARNAGL